MGNSGVRLNSDRLGDGLDTDWQKWSHQAVVEPCASDSANQRTDERNQEIQAAEADGIAGNQCREQAWTEIARRIDRIPGWAANGQSNSQHAHADHEGPQVRTGPNVANVVNDSVDEHDQEEGTDDLGEILREHQVLVAWRGSGVEHVLEAILDEVALIHQPD